MDKPQPPRSVKQLYKLMQRQTLAMDERESKVYMQVVHNAVFAQFLGDHVFLKGGAALQLSYPLSQSRASQDVDAVYASSKQTFEQNLVNSLKQGWGGFTGTVDRLPHGPKTLLPEGKGMARYTVKLLYLGKPFTSIYVEAVPDINACANHARHRMDDGTARLLEQLGLPVQTIPVMDPLTQMAEKMHALCRPGKIRGKDIADLTLMLEHEDVNLEALRQACRSVEKVQGQHVIGRLDDDRKADYRRQYEEAGPPSRFNDALDTVRTLLKQVEIGRAHV